MDPGPKALISTAAHLAATLAIIAAITWLDFRLLAVNSTTAALTLLLVILAIATRWGLLEATVASVLAVQCVNYFFLPPVSTLTIADPQNWVALLTFLVTSIVASQPSASARNRATDATRRQHEMEELYALSRSLLLLDATKVSAPGQLAHQIAQVFGITAGRGDAGHRVS